jgi:hypothetical protein
VGGSSFNSPKRSSLSSISRNNNGNWLLEFSGFIGIFTFLCVKLDVILNSFKIAQAKGFWNIIIESYSTLVFNFVFRGTSQLHPYTPFIQQISHLHQRYWNVSFQHILREGNECANWLTKTEVSSNNTLKIWNNCPPRLNLVLMIYVVGVARPWV